MNNMSSSSWWSYILRGLVAILFGVALLVWPTKTLPIIALFFAIYAFIHGITLVINALRVRQQYVGWWMELVVGLLTIGLGIAVLAWPGKTALTVLILVAVYALITGVNDIFTAVRNRDSGRSIIWLAIAGIVAILFGIYAILNPGSGAVVLSWLIALYAIVTGVLAVVHGVRVRREPEPIIDG